MLHVRCSSHHQRKHHLLGRRLRELGMQVGQLILQLIRLILEVLHGTALLAGAWLSGDRRWERVLLASGRQAAQRWQRRQELRQALLPRRQGLDARGRLAGMRDANREGRRRQSDKGLRLLLAVRLDGPLDGKLASVLNQSGAHEVARSLAALVNSQCAALCGRRRFRQRAHVNARTSSLVLLAEPTAYPKITTAELHAKEQGSTAAGSTCTVRQAGVKARAQRAVLFSPLFSCFF